MSDLPSLFGDAHRRRTTRGSGPLSLAEARRYAARFPGPTVDLLGVPIPELLFHRGTVIQASQGFGKTLTILRLLSAVLRRMRDPKSRERVIIVDRKGDVTSAVLAMAKALCPGVPVYLLNPFDRFGWALDPHEFATDPTTIVRLIAALTYRRRDARSDDFFDNSARSYLVLLVKILKAVAEGRWTWRAFYHVATSYDLLQRVVKASPLGRAKAGSIVRKTFAGIVSTIDSWLSEFESAIACWEISPKLRLEEFLRRRGILIITAPEDQIEVLTPVTRLVLRIVKDRVLADTGRDPTSKTVIVLDEFADLEELVPIIMPFFGRGRSAQASLIVAWQNYAAACDAHGEQRMKAILDAAAIRLFMGSGDDSARVAESFLGTREQVRPEYSFGYGDGGPGPTSRTVSYRTELVKNVLDGEVTALLPPTESDLTVRGFISAGHLPGPVYAEQDYGSFVRFLNGLPRVKPFRPRPAPDLTIAPWDDDTDGALLDVLFADD